MSYVGRYEIDNEIIDVVADNGKHLTLVIRSLEAPIDGDKLDRLRNGLADMLKLVLAYDGTPTKHLREAKKYKGFPLVYNYRQSDCHVTTPSTDTISCSIALKMITISSRCRTLWMVRL